jgi:branched-chain amino acid transport system substrate-binding protein
MNNYKKFALPLIVVLLVVFYFGFVNQNKNNNKPVVNIGITLPLSGNFAELGDGCMKAIETALAEVNSNENNKYEYKVVVEDDRLDIKKAIMNYNRLKMKDIKTFVTITSGISKAIVPLAEKDKLIHLSIASQKGLADGRYNFSHWTQAEPTAKKMLDEFKKRNIKSYVMLITNNEGSINLGDRLLDETNKSDIKNLAYEKINNGERDFRTLLNKLDNLNPDIWVISLYNPEQDILRKQMLELGIETPITSLTTFTNSNRKELFEGYWYVDGAAGTKEWINKLKSKYGNISTFASGNYYDWIKIMALAYENVEVKESKYPNTEDIIDYILNIKEFNGALGQIYPTKEGVFHSNASLMIIKNAKVKILEE